MSTANYLQLVIFIVALLALVKPLGSYMVKVFNGGKTFLDPVLCPIEKTFYRLCHVDVSREQNWKEYAISLITFSFIGLIVLYFILRLQYWLPFNPQHFVGLSPYLAFNTAISFVSNTDWQAYGGENTMSYFSQMTGLTVQNFLSASCGLAVAIAVIRGFSRSGSSTIGNFWVDLTRGTLWVFLPLSIILAILYLFQGIPQNLMDYINATPLTGGHQLLAQGPIATQEAIKSLGTNGGGFFNVNSAHPYENPTPFTNFLQALSVFSIGSALTYTFGKMIQKRKQGWMLLSGMLILFVASWGIMQYAEMHPNNLIAKSGVVVQATALQSGGNMEGKETRFGVAGSVLYDSVSTAASDGGVNSALDSYTPIGGGVAIFNMALGELIIGGVGAGLYTILMYVLITVFIAGLMVGRTPELFGKKITAHEMKLVMLSVLVSPIVMLVFTAIGCLSSSALQSVANQGPHGFSEILYAFVSSAANNGSAFSGLNANTTFFDVCTGIAIYLGRFFMIIPIIGVAGLFAAKNRAEEQPESLSTTGPLFVCLLMGTILLIAGLEFLPALVLGPIAEHLAMLSGQVF